MNKSIKSSITLAPAELKLVNVLQVKLRARTDVVRRGLRMLRDATGRTAIRACYRTASLATHHAVAVEVSKREPLASDGLADE